MVRVRMRWLWMQTLYLGFKPILNMCTVILSFTWSDSQPPRELSLFCFKLCGSIIFWQHSVTTVVAVESVCCTMLRSASVATVQRHCSHAKQLLSIDKFLLKLEAPDKGPRQHSFISVFDGCSYFVTRLNIETPLRTCILRYAFENKKHPAVVHTSSICCIALSISGNCTNTPPSYMAAAIGRAGHPHYIANNWRHIWSFLLIF